MRIGITWDNNFKWVHKLWMKLHDYVSPFMCDFANACQCNEEGRVHGDTTNRKVRMANVVAENAATLIALTLQFRPSTWLVVEQPKGSQMWKLPIYKSLISSLGLAFVLTYLGLYGMDILKGCHLCTNLDEVRRLARKATKDVKAKFDQEIARRKEKMRREGKTPKVYYTTGVSKKTGRKTFTGGKSLQDTALYPIRFCNALFHCWLRARTHALELAQPQVVLD